MSASDATPPGDGEGTRLSIGAVIAIAVAVLAIAGVGGYLIGHSEGEKSGDTKGYDDGLAAGKSEVEAQYQRGAAGYRAIFLVGKRAGYAEGVARGKRVGTARGEKQGEKVGFEQGERQGISTGQTEGVRQGAAAVLGGFDTWTDGAYYLITMSGSSQAGVPYVISSRTQLQPATDYRLCNDGGTQTVCQSPVGQAAGAGGSGGTGGNADNGGAQE
jgi:hypothetical protein